MVDDAIVNAIKIKLDKTGTLNRVAKAMAGNVSEINATDHGLCPDRRRPKLKEASPVGAELEHGFELSQ
jgi:hypothetical protein